MLGPPRNAQDLAGFTPLMWASGRDSADGVKMLLDCEAGDFSCWIVDMAGYGSRLSTPNSWMVLSY